MSRIGQFVRSRTGAVVISAAVLSGGLGVGAVAMASTGAPVEVQQPETSTPAAATEATAPEPAPEPVAATVEQVTPTVVDVPDVAPAPPVDVVTVPDMNIPAPALQTTAAPAPEPADDPSIGSVGPDGNYTPAPPQQRPGEPPIGVIEFPPPAELLPGEPGYVG